MDRKRSCCPAAPSPEQSDTGSSAAAALSDTPARRTGRHLGSLPFRGARPNDVDPATHTRDIVPRGPALFPILLLSSRPFLLFFFTLLTSPSLLAFVRLPALVPCLSIALFHIGWSSIPFSTPSQVRIPVCHLLFESSSCHSFELLFFDISPYSYFASFLLHLFYLRPPSPSPASVLPSNPTTTTTTTTFRKG